MELFPVAIIIVSIFLGWALLMVSWLITGARKDAQRSLDCIMTLVNERKAVLSSQLTHTRENAPYKPTKKEQNDIETLNKQVSIFEQVTHTGEITEEDLGILKQKVN